MEKQYNSTVESNVNQEINNSSSYDGYYLVSKKWSLLNDEYITFVRKNNLAYCYDLNWAGPKTGCEKEDTSENDKIILVKQTLILPFIKKINFGGKESYRLPNTEEVRRAVGFWGFKKAS